MQCTRRTADAVRKGLIIKGEEIKAHAKKKRDADSSDKEELSDDDDHGGKRRGAGKGDGRDGKSSKAALVAQIKVNMFNIWPKIKTLISNFNFFRRG